MLILDEEQYLNVGLPVGFKDIDFELDVLNGTEYADTEGEDGEVELEGAKCTQYRATAARLDYRAPDRMDIQLGP